MVFKCLGAAPLVNQPPGHSVIMESQQSVAGPHSTPLATQQALGYQMTGKL